ncbi:hypothetical protein ACIXQX_01590 [Bacteroides fragilis]
MPNHTPSPATDEATSSPNEQEQLSPEQEEEMKLKIQELQQKEEELNLRAEKLDKLAKELEERQQNLENRNPNDERSIEPATHPDHSFPSQIGDQINALKNYWKILLTKIKSLRIFMKNCKVITGIFMRKS